MACNCSKSRKPAGARKPPATGSGSASSGDKQTFVLEHTSGRAESFGSRLEAAAARVRAGEGTIRVC